MVNDLFMRMTFFSQKEVNSKVIKILAVNSKNFGKSKFKFLMSAEQSKVTNRSERALKCVGIL